MLGGTGTVRDSYLAVCKSLGGREPVTRQAPGDRENEPDFLCQAELGLLLTVCAELDKFLTQT